MRFIFFCVFVGLSNIGCSQMETRIIKKCSSPANSGFVEKNCVCQKLFYKDSRLIGEVNYSYNGWQIYDSICYETKGSSLCKKTFSPFYEEGSRVALSYKIKENTCVEEKTFSSHYLSMIDDKYFLSRPYLADLNLLLEMKPVKSINQFEFKDGVIPSILGGYGIPYNAVLKSFSFSIGNDNLITTDNFYFSDYTVKREYKYLSKILKEVIVVVKNEKANRIFNYTESFDVQRL